MKLVDPHQSLLGQLNQIINKGFAALAATAMLGLMFLTVVDVVLRKMGMQIAGSFEFIGWLSAMAMGLSLGYVQLHKGHVAITAISELDSFSSSCCIANVLHLPAGDHSKSLRLAFRNITPLDLPMGSRPVCGYGSAWPCVAGRLCSFIHNDCSTPKNLKLSSRDR